MTTTPYVELRFNPTDLRPRDLPSAGKFLGSPADAIQAGLAVVRARMVAQMKAEVRGLAEPSHGQILQIADLAWQLFLPEYRRISAPVMADAYIHAYKRANAGDVPMSVIYDLADKHAEKTGDYFHASSRDALADGFNTMVNRRIPARAAADKVLDAYGLTPRQMRGYANNKQLMTPIDSPVPFDVKSRSREYIDRSFTTRIRTLSEQEEHNIDQQAQQFAWMWLQDKGRLTEKAQKMWLTANDERVCPVCGPLHGQKVAIGEQFVTHVGAFWTPGVHPNCRCEIRLIENRFSKRAGRLVVQKDDWEPKLHPRGGDPENPGRFSRVAEHDRKPVINIAEPDVIETTEAPVIDLSGTVNLGARPTGRVDLSAPAPVDLSSPEVDLSGPAIDLSGPAIDLSPPQVNLMDLALPKVSVAPTVSDITVLREPKPKKKTKMVEYEEIRPLEQSYYRVVSGSPGFQQFDKNVFSADRDQVILDAADVREKAINSVMDQHAVNGQVMYREATGSYTVPLVAKIPAEEFRNILEVVAQQGTSEPPHDALVDVDYYDPDGQEDDAPIETVGRTVLDIAHAVGVDPDHLAVHVAMLDAVHSENVGRGTAQRQQIVGRPYDEYEITGDYSVNDYQPEYEEGTGTPIGMDIYYMEPHDPKIGLMAAPD